MEKADEIRLEFIRKLLELDPGIVNRALNESGAISAIPKLNEGISAQHPSGAGDVTTSMPLEKKKEVRKDEEER